MVILLHVSGADAQALGPAWKAGNFWNALTRSCVPLFFMLSGATLLPRRQDALAFYRRRLLRLLPPLLLWSCFYLWLLQADGIATGNWLLAILAGPTAYHLWYFYALLGLTLFIPVLQPFYQQASQRDRLGFLAIWFLVSAVFPLAYSLTSLPGCGHMPLGPLAVTWHLQYFGGYIGFLVLGAVLRDVPGRLWTGLGLFALASAGTALLTWQRSMAMGEFCSFYYIYTQPLVILAGAGLFLAARGLPEGASPPWLREAAACTLGVYGLHVYLISVFADQGWRRLTTIAWIDAPLASLGILLLGLALVGAARRIRPLRVAV